MKNLRYYIIYSFIFVVTACSDSNKQFTGVWVAAAPVSDGIFYQPNLIAEITPKNMVLHQDLDNSTEYKWKKKGSKVTYENQAGQYQFNILKHQEHRLVLLLGKRDTMHFQRLKTVDKQLDASVLENWLYNNTFELNIPDIGLEMDNLIFCPKGQLFHLHHRLEVDSTRQEMKQLKVVQNANWQIQYINGHYFLYLKGLKTKPILAAFEDLTEFKATFMAFKSDSHRMTLRVMGSEVNVSNLKQEFIGQWKSSTMNIQYNFKDSLQYVRMEGDSSTIEGKWRINTTGDLLVLLKDNEIEGYSLIQAPNNQLLMEYWTQFDAMQVEFRKQ